MTSNRPANPPGIHPAPSTQPPSSQQTNAPGQPAEPGVPVDAPVDSATAAQRAMKQTSKTPQETGTTDD